MKQNENNVTRARLERIGATLLTSSNVRGIRLVASIGPSSTYILDMLINLELQYRLIKGKLPVPELKVVLNVTKRQFSNVFRANEMLNYL